MINKHSRVVKYNDFSVMAYVVWLGIAALSCVFSNVLIATVIFVIAIAWFFYAKQSKDSWACNIAYRIWGISIIFIFGIINFIKIMTGNIPSELNIFGGIVIAVGIISIHIIWWSQLKHQLQDPVRLNGGITESGVWRDIEEGGVPC